MYLRNKVNPRKKMTNIFRMSVADPFRSRSINDLAPAQRRRRSGCYMAISPTFWFVVCILYCITWFVVCDYFWRQQRQSIVEVKTFRGPDVLLSSLRRTEVVSSLAAPASLLSPRRIVFLDSHDDVSPKNATSMKSDATILSSSTSTTTTRAISPYETPVASWNQFHKRLEEEKAKTLEEDYECVPMYEWQQFSFPTCNTLHELSISQPDVSSIEFINCGMSRCAFQIKTNNGQETLVIKLFRYDRDKKSDVTSGYLEQSRTDSLVMERLTKSKYIQDIFGYCGLSQIVEYSSWGNIHDRVKQARQLSTKMSEISISSTTSSIAAANRQRIMEARQQRATSAISKGRRGYTTIPRPNTARMYNENAATSVFGSTRNKAIMVYQVLSAVADLHSYGGIAHKDICCHQIVNFDGIYKLGDFHSSSLVERNTDSGEACGEEPNGFEKVRAPEEYRALEFNRRAEELDLDEQWVDGIKMDVYMTGNVIYYILTHQWLFEHTSSLMTHKMMSNGQRSSIPLAIQNSQDPYILLMIKLLDMCWTDDPEKRPSARTIVSFMTTELQKIEPDIEVLSSNFILTNMPTLPKDHRHTDTDFMRNLEI